MTTPLHDFAADLTFHLSGFAPEQREEEAYALLAHVRDILASILQDLKEEETGNDN